MTNGSRTRSNEMLNEGLASANEEGWIDEDSMRLHFKDKFKVNKRECSSKLQKRTWRNYKIL